MDTMRKNQINRKKGVALIYIVLVLAVITIFSLIVVNYVTSNILQAKTQERTLQAYYLSLSGTDLCLAALLQEGVGGSQDTLLYEHFNPAILNPAPLTDTLVLSDGVVLLDISAETRDGERWIIIESEGVLNSSDVSQTTYLEFLYTNPLIQKKR